MDSRRIDVLLRYEGPNAPNLTECWATVYDEGELVGMRSFPIGPFDTTDDLLERAYEWGHGIPYAQRFPLT